MRMSSLALEASLTFLHQWVLLPDFAVAPLLIRDRTHVFLTFVHESLVCHHHPNVLVLDPIEMIVLACLQRIDVICPPIVVHRSQRCLILIL